MKSKTNYVVQPPSKFEICGTSQQTENAYLNMRKLFAKLSSLWHCFGNIYKTKCIYNFINCPLFKNYT